MGISWLVDWKSRSMNNNVKQCFFTQLIKKIQKTDWIAGSVFASCFISFNGVQNGSIVFDIIHFEVLIRCYIFCCYHFDRFAFYFSLHFSVSLLFCSSIFNQSPSYLFVTFFVTLFCYHFDPFSFYFRCIFSFHFYSAVQSPTKS